MISSLNRQLEDLTECPAEDIQKKCDYCEKGYAVRDIGRNIRAWINGEEFVIQEFNRKTDKPFERKFKIKYCPYCGRKIKKNRWHYEDGMPEEKEY